MTVQFVKATKQQARARVTIDGASGSGKTYSALILATVLAAQEKSRIAVIDTERGSASLYSDLFDFDVLNLGTDPQDQEPFRPSNYTAAIKAAEGAGYKVIVIDSLSHAWEGSGGALELVDKASMRNKGNSYVSWRDVTPEHRGMVDAILQSSAHVITTMRSKMDYVQEKDAQGKTVIRKIGMAPIQRQGMEYEFTLVGDMDTDHHISITKSRCTAMTDRVAVKPGPEFWKPFITWLNDGAPTPTPVPTLTRTEPPAQQTDGTFVTPPAQEQPASKARFTPAELKDKLQKRSTKIQGFAEQSQTNAMVAALEGVLGGSDQRHEFIRWLTNGETDSTKKLSNGMNLALYEWIKPAYNKDAKVFEADEHARAEATAAHREYLQANGAQGELL